MKVVPIVLALAFAACASAPKGVSTPDRPVQRAVIAPLEDGRVVTLVADGVWAPLPRKPGEPIILQHQDVPTAAVALFFREAELGDRKSTRLNSSHIQKSRMPSSA